MELLEGILTRRSVRQYAAEPVARETILEVVRAGAWAPSGLNNQPWRFVIVTDGAVKAALAGLTSYRNILLSAPAAIVLFLDRTVIYNEMKDYQAIGACMQNMLLAAHGLGLGAVWLGEIVKNADKVRELLEAGPDMELMAVVALGHPTERQQRSKRKPLDELILAEI